jgi:hypothetical protein
VNRSLSFHLVRGRDLLVVRSFRRRSNRLVLEPLERRQLLSIASAAASPVAVPSSLTAAPLAINRIPTGFLPNQIRQAYGISQVTFQGGTISGNGAGQTIAIVTANDDPNIGADLKHFDSQMGLPAPPSFVKYLQVGMTPVDAGWSLEASLDVEWAHATAPGANLVLVEAKSASFTDLFNAVNFARSLPGVVAVSMSWGSSEFYGENAFDGLFTTPAGHIGGSNLPGGVTFVAASGDSGAWSGVSYPAASPNVLSVGATSLYLWPGSSYQGEIAWTGSTGGFSALEQAPTYQWGAQLTSGLAYGLRTVPDVSAVGDPATGLAVYDSVPYGGQSGWFSVGGTSGGAPQWAGLIAIADQGLALAGKGSLANAQAALYSIPSSAFHDVTVGFNGYSATPGYDLVTGLGTPVASGVVGGLLASQGVLNVSGFPSPPPVSVLRSVTAHAIDVLSSNTNSATTGPITSTTTSTTSLFPVNIVVIIVPVGSTEVVVILPPAPVPASPFSSATHLVEPQALFFVGDQGVTANTLSVLAKFGQGPAIGLPLPLTSKLNPEVESTALIDLILPLNAPAPKAIPKAVARSNHSDRTETPVKMPLSLLPALELEVPGVETRPATSRQPTPVAPGPLPSRDAGAVREDEESRKTEAAAPLAGAAALAGAGYWLALRDSERRRRGWIPHRFDQSIYQR